jgi:sugar lactone lactonase YvrE
MRTMKGGTEQEFIEIFKTLGNDNRLAYYMLARTYMKLDESQNSMVSLKNTSNWQSVPTFIKQDATGRYLPTVNFYDMAPPSDNPFVTKETLEKDNLVMLIQMGFAPVKQIAGVEGQRDFLAPRYYPERKAVVYIDGKELGEAYPMFNLMHQAVCTIRTRKDTAQTGKAAGKLTATILSALVSDDLARLVDDMWSVAADTRRWGSLPNEIHLFSGRVEPGLHTLTVLFYDQAGNPLPHYEQTHYFVPIRENEETFLVLRSLRDKGNTVRDFFGSKVTSYNEKKNEIVFNTKDLADITVGRNLDIVSIDFGDARLNQQFIEEGSVPSPGRSLKKSPGTIFAPRVTFAQNYQESAVTDLQKRFDQKYKGFTVTKVGVARVLQIQGKRTVCTVVKGTLYPKQTYFITDYQVPVSVIKEESNHDVVSAKADKSITSGSIIAVPHSASTSTVLRFAQVWGKKGEGAGDFLKPCGVAADGSGNVYVADTYNNRIQVFDNNGTFVKAWGQKGTDSGNVAGPWDVAVDGEGCVYVADTYNHRVQKFDVNGVYLGQWGQKGKKEGEFAFLSGIALGPDGAVYTVDAKMNRIQVFDSQGKFLRSWGSKGRGPGEFVTPMGLTVDESGNVYVADSKMRRVQKFDSEGRFLAAFTDSLLYPVDVAIDNASGNLLVLDAASHLIWEMSPTGQSLRSYGGPGRGSGEFSKPYGFSTDGASNVFVVDTGNSRVQKFSH